MKITSSVIKSLHFLLKADVACSSCSLQLIMTETRLRFIQTETHFTFLVKNK